MQFPQNSETFLALNVAGLSLQPLVHIHVWNPRGSQVFIIDCFVQQRWKNDNIFGILQLLGRNFVRVRAALCDDMMVLISGARAAKPLSHLVWA